MKTAGATTLDAALAQRGRPGVRAKLSATVRRRAWWTSLAALCAVAIAPLLVVDVPPLIDYPNHLARAFVLASLPSDPWLATFFSAHWAIIPNLAVDLMAPPLMRLLPVHDVGRLLLAAAVVLPLLGTAAYGSALGGRWWCLAAGLVAYNGTLMEGFLNFNLSIGAALLLAAGWLRWRDSRPVATAALAMAGAAALFACHLMGLLFFAALLTSAEAFRLLRDRPRPALLARFLLRQATARGGMLLLVFAVPAALYSVSPLRALGGDAEFLPPLAKLAQLLAPFTNYDRTLDVVTAVLALACPCACLALRRGRVPGQAAIAAAVILVAYLGAPYAWKGTSQLDTRFAVMLALMLFAGFIPVGWPPWLCRVGVATTMLLFAARLTLLTVAWAQHRADLADLRAALAPVRPGQAVYVVSVRPADPAGHWARAPWSRRLSNGVRTDLHLGALALIERRAWWPFEFDIPSQQPIETREPYRSLALRVGDLPDQAALQRADLCGFDAVLLTNADAAPDLPDARFRLLVRTGFAALYRIDACRPPD